MKLDIGGGKHPQPGHLNVDLRAIPEVDVQASATELPFPDDSAERIHCNSLIPHLEDLNEAFAEWSRVLEPGGELVVKATHGHSTGIIADADHNHWSWTSESPRYFGDDFEYEYYNETDLRLMESVVVGWLRPERWWLRAPSWAFKHLIKRVSNEVADELMKLPFAGGRVVARYKGV